MMFPKKKKRVVDEDLLQDVRDQCCFFCYKNPPSDPHHITTRGAGGGDTENNLLPLCRKHHTQLHQIGYSEMSWKHPKLKEWLMRNSRFDIIEKMGRNGKLCERDEG